MHYLFYDVTQATFTQVVKVFQKNLGVIAGCGQVINYSWKYPQNGQNRSNIQNTGSPLCFEKTDFTEDLFLVLFYHVQMENEVHFYWISNLAP